MAEVQLLKKDMFGEIRVTGDGNERRIVRDTSTVTFWFRWVSRALMRREARVLAVLTDLDGVPQILALEHNRLVRQYIGGMPMQFGRPTNPEYFKDAMHLLRRLHAAGVVHNDLAKEPNILVRDDGTPAFLDFQLAWHTTRRGKLFRLLGHEDLRHLLKHKRTYCPEALTRREQHILKHPMLLSRLWRQSVKRVYRFVTRRLLGWADREGAGNRGDMP